MKIINLNNINEYIYYLEIENIYFRLHNKKNF